MSDRPHATEEPTPWRLLRQLEPPLGSKQSVLADLEYELDLELSRSPRRKRWTWLAVPATALAGLAALWALRAGPGDEMASSTPATPPAELAEASGAAPEELQPEPEATEPRPKAPAMASQITLGENDRISVALDKASVTVQGPAAVRVGSAQLAIERGTVEVAGNTTIVAPTCSVRISGQAEFAVSEALSRVRIFAGSAEVLPESTSCTVQRFEFEDAGPEIAQQARDEIPDDVTNEVPARSRTSSGDRVDDAACVGAGAAWPVGGAYRDSAGTLT